MDVALQFRHTLFLDRHVGIQRAGHFQMFKNWALLLFPESCLTENSAPANYFLTSMIQNSSQPNYFGPGP